MALFLAGKDSSEIVTELRGEKSDAGKPYQKKLRLALPVMGENCASARERVGESQVSFSQAVAVLRRRGSMVRFVEGQYEITGAGDATMQLVDRAGLILKAQALLQLDQAPAGDDQVSDEGQ